ncbi:hypothetical protein COY05_03575 [Candidatus Peregrinibacteria bacterium CG_4_10_14_0_2_um_filter_38_24]|nr:MAG: hypothetical protein COY05_03575 [Candidatus Peregrinibacteria bacterium CG_4_10_14_0_2_um_filter_38_24]
MSDALKENPDAKTPQAGADTPLVKQDGSKTKRDAAHVLLDKQGVEDDSARQEKAAEEAKAQIQNTLSLKAKGGLSSRGDFSASVTSEVLLSSANRLEYDWSVLREKFWKRVQSGERLTYADLTKETSKIEKQMQEASGMITAYILEMAAKSPDGQLSEQALAEMRDSVNRSSVAIAEIALKQESSPELVEALQFALNVKKVDESKVFDTLSKIISTKSELFPYAWTALSFMNEKLQIKFGKYYIEKNKLNSEDALKFLETWSVQGNISLQAMRKILEDSKINTKELEVKAQEYARNWQVKNDLRDAADTMAGSSYGAVNQAGQMLSPSGILTFAAKTWAIGAIGMNLAVSTFYGGKINSIPHIMKAMATNPYVLTGAGVLAAFKAKELAGSVSEAVKSPEQRATEEEKAAKGKFNLLIGGNPDLKDFFEGKEGPKRNYLASKYYFDFLQYVHKEFGKEDMPFPERVMTKGAFLAWLESRLPKVEEKEKKEITKVITSLKSLNISEDRLNYYIYNLAVPFDKLAIGGIETEKNYLKALA